MSALPLGRFRLLLACHICALTVGALPRPGAMRPVDPPRSSQRNALSALLTPVLDSAAARFIEVHQAAWRATAPLQGFVRWYIGLTGLGQRWRMFMNPPDYDEYLRARYYVGTHDTAAVKWVATELIFPAHREDQVRLVQSFRDSYTDKAIAIALSAFLRARFAAGAEVPEDETDLPENLAPDRRLFQPALCARVARAWRASIENGVVARASPQSRSRGRP